MTEALLFVGIGSLLLLCIAAIGVAALAYQNARRYVELAEERLEHLREGQAHLLMFLLEERQSLKEELEQEREQHRETRRSTQRLPLLQVQSSRRAAEEFEHEEEEPLEARQEREGRDLHTRRGVERRIGQLERELRVLQKVHQHREAGQESTPPTSERSFAGVPETRGLSGEKGTPTPEEDKRPRLAVWHPHPDDDVSPGSAARAPSDAPVEMFRRHYDKYLENYEGYVKLAQRICRMRDDAEVPPGSLAEREWEERLRRVNDGIERTTARLDILEQYNPELVTDDRISHRASIARSHSQLERSGRDRSS
jgi:hypothetical protein